MRFKTNEDLDELYWKEGFVVGGRIPVSKKEFDMYCDIVDSGIRGSEEGLKRYNRWMVDVRKGKASIKYKGHPLYVKSLWFRLKGWFYRTFEKEKVKDIDELFFVQ